MRPRVDTDLQRAGFGRGAGRYHALQVRHLLKRHKLAEKIPQISTSMLKAHGRFVQPGFIEDATILSALSSTKTRGQHRDPGTQKGHLRRFGMTTHVGTTIQGHVHRVMAIAANIHDFTVMAD